MRVFTGLVLALGAMLPAPKVELAAGTPWQTPLFERRGAESGPTVLVIAGIHGDERAPPHAARELLDIELRRGRLIIVPEANRRALAVGHRHTPGTRYVDLNRNFPIESRLEPRGTLAAALWQTTLDLEPDWVLDLHEGFDFHRRNKKSVGSSVVYVPHAEVGACGEWLAERVVEAVDRGIEAPSKRFSILKYGPKASFARSVTERLGIPSLVFETTRIGQPVSLRVSQHRTMLDRALRELGLTGESASSSCAKRRKP